MCVHARKDVFSWMIGALTDTARTISDIEPETWVVKFSEESEENTQDKKYIKSEKRLKSFDRCE